MATYLKLRRMDETGDEVSYLYSPDERATGRIVLDKASGDTRNAQPLSDDQGDRHYLRASARLRRAWREKSFPDTMEFAS